MSKPIEITEQSFKEEVLDSDIPVLVDYGIRSIPTLIIFKNGAPGDQIVGAVGKNILVERINKSL